MNIFEEMDLIINDFYIGSYKEREGRKDMKKLCDGGITLYGEELNYGDFVARGFNPDYYNEWLNGDITAYSILGGLIAEAEGASGQIIDTWDEGIYSRITWE